MSPMSNANARFRQWTDEVGTAAAAREFARVDGVKVAPSYLSHIRAGRRSPGLKLAAAIERASAGWAHGPIYCREWTRPEPIAAEAA